MIDGEHRHGEGRFQRGVFVEVVDDNLGVGIPLELDDHAGFFRGLVAHGADVGKDLFVDELCNPFDQLGPVHVVGNLGEDDRLAVALHLLHARLAAHAQGAFSGVKILSDWLGAKEHTSRREVGPLDVGHEPVNGDFRVVDLRADGVDDFGQVVRRDVGGHPDGDACAAVDEQVGPGGWEDGGFLAGFVVVGDEIDGVLFHVVHERGSEVAQARLGVTHGRGWIAFDRAEVALAFDEHFAHGPGLGHVDEGGVDGLVTMGVVVTHGFPDDLGALQVLARRSDAEFAHGEQDAALGGLQAVPRVRQGAGDDHRHRVCQKGLGHLVGDVHFFDFFVLRVHRGVGRDGRLGLGSGNG